MCTDARMYVRIYMCVYLYGFIYVRVRTYMCIVHACIIGTYVCKDMLIIGSDSGYVYAYVHTYVCTYVHTHTYVHMYVCVYTHLCTYVHRCVHMYMQ